MNFFTVLEFCGRVSIFFFWQKEILGANIFEV